MKWFYNLPARSKMLFGAFSAISLFIVIIVAGLISFESISRNQKVMKDFYFNNVVKMTEMKADLNRFREKMLTLMLSENHNRMMTIKSEVERIMLEINNQLIYSIDLNKDDTTGTRLLRIIQLSLDEYFNTADEQITLVLEGHPDEALSISLSVQDTRYEKIRSMIKANQEDSQQKYDLNFNKNRRYAAMSETIFIVLGILAVIIAFVAIVFISRIIAGPLQDLSGFAEKISEGDLSITIPVTDRRDEVGALTSSFSKMVQSLKEMADSAGQIAEGDLSVSIKPRSEKDILGHSFEKMIVSLRNMSKEITEGVNVLASSASELLAASTQLASGAAETSTAVVETTTTLEEVKQTSMVASQKSKTVSDQSQNVKTVAESGRKFVGETIEAMNSIHEQMDSVADTIVRLSDQSQAIGEIIASVNNLAEQSNLLAVNASIEAAKAGDQGKGFAVVAQEIKSMADKSRQATAQVRSILMDIQKTISSAMMAAEQGSRTVKTGVNKSMESGESIRLLGDTIAEAAQAAMQIAATSQQQLAGIEQVTQAMEEIKQSALQSSSSTKQVENSARSLHELGNNLKSLVSYFKL